MGACSPSPWPSLFQGDRCPTYLQHRLIFLLEVEDLPRPPHPPQLTRQPFQYWVPSAVGAWGTPATASGVNPTSCCFSGSLQAAWQDGLTKRRPNNCWSPRIFSCLSALCGRQEGQDHTAAIQESHSVNWSEELLRSLGLPAGSSLSFPTCWGFPEVVKQERSILQRLWFQLWL